MTDKDRPNIDRDKIVLGPGGTFWLRLKVLDGEALRIRADTINRYTTVDHEPDGTGITGLALDDGRVRVKEPPSEIDALLREAAEMESERLQDRRIGTWLDRLAKEANR